MKKSISLICAIVLLLTAIFVPTGMIVSAATDGVIVDGASHDVGYGWDSYKNYSVTFDTPVDASGANGTIEITYWANAAAGIHLYPLQLYINGNTVTVFGSQVVNFSTEKQTYVYDLSTATVDITDEDLANITGYRVQMTTDAMPGVVAYFTMKAPRGEVKPVAATRTDEDSMNAGAWGSGYGYAGEDFNPALDMSGSNGTLVLKYKATTSANMHMLNCYIFANGKTIYLAPFFLNATTDYQDYVINLADYGLTDEDLKKVTGYQFNASSQGDGADFIFYIEAPRAPVVTSKTDEDSMNAGAWGSSYGYAGEDFNPALDMSGSNGTLVLKYKATTSVSMHLLNCYIFANGKTIYLAPFFLNATTDYQDYVINLADYGLTDEDLKKVTGYQFNASSQGDGADFIFYLEAPRPPVVTYKTDEDSMNAGAWGSSYGYAGEDFNPALDMSGSNGTFVLKYKATTSVSMHLMECYIFANGKTIYLAPFFLNATTDYQDYVINLADYGLTDEDLKKVTGYRFNASSQGDGADFIFYLEAPRPPVKATSFSGEHIVGDWGYASYSSTFDTPIDMSGSDGTLVLKNWVSDPTDVHIAPLTIYINGKSLSYTYHYAANLGTDAETVVLKLADYGLTDEDLKNVTGYSITLGSGFYGSTYYFEIEAPQIPVDAAEKLVWITKILLFGEDIPGADLNGDGSINVLDFITAKKTVG